MDVNNVYGWAMSKNLPVKKIESIEDTSQLNENFIRNWNEESDDVCLAEIVVRSSEKWTELHNDLLFLPERMNTEVFKNLVANLHD